MKTIRTILLLISLSLYAFQTWAVPAYPYPVKITQPDGSTLNLLLKGDEHHHYATTEDGIAVIRNSKGVYNYARIDAQGKLTDLKMQANNAALRGATERNFIASIQSESGAGTPSKVTQSKLRSRNAMLAGKPQRFPLTGTPRSLVIAPSRPIGSPSAATTARRFWRGERQDARHGRRLPASPP